ncbi:hypothetical protein NA56DRAFT_730363 [Hyaloscypha hepaticicola]|uniref:Uncharacterized protein n=1 Tax=Hyaloscypha hepaticicola TaxID=2082293 RepID=A0A2J6QKX0_9HELO|nr:hypothetical protein NA56DRAFT_730363 [Hyaloscypha hepaticicola]
MASISIDSIRFPSHSGYKLGPGPNHTEDDENIPKATDRLCNEVELFTDLYKATIKLEFFVDFPKPIKGKYPTTPVPFIPIILIKRVILKKEEKSFWDALKSQKKENRRQVFVRSTANLVSLVKAMKCWPHPESSDSDRQGLYKQVAQSRSVMIYFLDDIAEAVDIKQIYTQTIDGNELAKEWAGNIMNVTLEKKWKEEQWERRKKQHAMDELIKI